MNQAIERQNKMGTMPIFKLLVTMSLPMVIAMLVQAFYNVVDTYFVTQIDPNALTAVSASFAVQNLMIGIATGTGVGINALLSRSLGEKNYERTNKIACNGILLALFSYLIVLIFGLFFVDTYFNAISDIPEVREYGKSYLSICCIYSLGIYIEIVFERLMQSTGKTVYTMFTQGTGAVINIILDWVLIFGIGPFEPMGIKGAAVATVIGQWISAILAVLLNQLKNHEIRITLSDFKPDMKIIGSIYAIGIPSIIMVAIGSIMNFAIGIILKPIDKTELAYGVFGLYFKLQSFIFMPIFGLNNGMIPIIAFNYGAKNRKRMIKTIKYAIIIAMTIMAIGFLLFQIIPGELLSIFAEEGVNRDAILAIGIPALKTISLCFLFAGACIVLGSVFQALGKGVISMIVSFARQLLVLVPAAYLLSLTGKVSAVWYAFPIAEIASLAVSLIAFIFIYKNIIRKIPDNNE